MKKFINYLLWMPFAICIGSLVIYLIYTIQIKMNSTIIITEELTNTLKAYLLVALVSLLIGLIIILIKKIYYLVKEDNEIQIEKPKKIKEVKEKTKIKLKKEKVKDNILKVKVTNPKLNGDKIVGKLEDTMQDVEVYIDDKKEYNFKLDGVACPECGGLISKDAAICPHCGILFDDEVLRFLTKKKNTKKKVSLKIILVDICIILLFMFLIFLIANKLINKGEQNYSNINPAVIMGETKEID